jgi:ferric-dicitrate binding protein FerR (iron transport regulator)
MASNWIAARSNHRRGWRETEGREKCIRKVETKWKAERSETSCYDASLPRKRQRKRAACRLVTAGFVGVIIQLCTNRWRSLLTC